MSQNVSISSAIAIIIGHVTKCINFQCYCYHIMSCQKMYQFPVLSYYFMSQNVPISSAIILCHVTKCTNFQCFHVMSCDSCHKMYQFPVLLLSYLGHVTKCINFQCYCYHIMSCHKMYQFPVLSYYVM